MDNFTTNIVTTNPTAANAQIDDLNLRIVTLESNLKSMTDNWSYASNRLAELRTKIENVRGHIWDIYSMNGEVDEDIQAIAELLDISLTKRISGRMTIEIDFSADVPLAFDPDDLELSYEISCDTYEADNFDFNEVRSDWTVEEDA
jgi:hypothetical protein